jgi:tetratricopeptide (TPR) repeat protein
MAEVSSPHPQPVALEADVPFSRSVIWRMQREFYLQRGLRAWSHDLVPNFITNNPFIAETYARIVLGFITDCIQQGLPPKTPVRILELGAGPGKFSYLFLRQLGPLLRDKGLTLSLVRYCMTDCSEAVIESWSSNSWLAEFVQDGILQFELLEAGENITSRFLLSGPAGRGPLVVIANYVFDSLPQDAFVIQDGRICQVLVTTQSPAEATGNKTELSRLQLSYKNVPLAADYYADQTWNEILDLYKARLTSATILFPASALRALKTLGQLSDGRMLVLAADKGFAHEDALQLSQGPPALEFHTPNCFSLMVNFDAMAKFFCAEGGQALLPDKHFSNLNLCGFLHGWAGYNFFQTKAAYDREQAGFGVDDLFTLLAWLNAHMEEMSVPQILAALRLTRWDPVAFTRLFPVLARQLRTVVTERNDLRTAIMRIWPNHYPINPNENEIAFQCGVVLLELRFYEDALAMFKTSQRIFGPSAATSYNLGLCFQGLKRSTDALACMIEACELDPNFEPARISRGKLEVKDIPS